MSFEGGNNCRVSSRGNLPHFAVLVCSPIFQLDLGHVYFDKTVSDKMLLWIKQKYFLVLKNLRKSPSLNFFPGLKLVACLWMTKAKDFCDKMKSFP